MHQKTEIGDKYYHAWQSIIHLNLKLRKSKTQYSEILKITCRMEIFRNQSGIDVIR